MTAPLRLQVLGATYELTIDHPELREALGTLYGRFRVGAESPAPSPAHTIRVTTEGRARIEIDGHTRSLAPAVAADHAFVALNETFLAGARSCRVLHAAALDHQGQGVLVAGPSTFGKSTLALLLLERGLGFLGDDFAPLELETGRILPFPKTIGLRTGVEAFFRPETLARLEAAPVATLWGKRLVDIDELFPGQLAEPVPVRHLFLLVPPEGPPPPGDHRLQIGVIGQVPRLPAALAALGELEGPMVSDGQVHLYYLTRDAAATVSDLAEALEPFRDRVLFTEKIPSVRPRFDGEPRLSPCPPTVGLFTLAADCLNRQGPEGRLLDPGENPVAVLRELGDHLTTTRFHYLHTGRFESMADLIVRTLGETA